MAVSHSGARGSLFVEGLTHVLDDGSHRNDHEYDAAGAGVGRPLFSKGYGPPDRGQRQILCVCHRMKWPRTEASFLALLASPQAVRGRGHSSLQQEEISIEIFSDQANEELE